MGHEINTVYTLTAPSGAVAVFNDDTDPDFAGYLTKIDKRWPSVRGGDQDRTAGHGGIQGARKWQSRLFICEGFIQSLPIDDRLEQIERLMLANEALDGDATLSWTDAASVDRQIMYLRLEPEHEIGGDLPKNFQFILRSKDYREYSQTINSETASFVAVTTGGITFPISFPFSFGGGTLVGNLTCTNAGNQPSPPKIRIDGPCLNPVIYSAENDAYMRIDYDLPAGDYLELERAADYPVKLNGTDDLYRVFDDANSTWWELLPGDNDIRIYADAYDATGGVTVYWRDAWL